MGHPSASPEVDSFIPTCVRMFLHSRASGWRIKWCWMGSRYLWGAGRGQRLELQDDGFMQSLGQLRTHPWYTSCLRCSFQTQLPRSTHTRPGARNKVGVRAYSTTNLRDVDTLIGSDFNASLVPKTASTLQFIRSLNSNTSTISIPT